MSDSRDSNHDGKVSFMEKIKHKLHKGRDKDAAEQTTIHTSSAAPATQPCNCPTCLESVGFPPAQAGTYTNGGYDPRYSQQHYDVNGQPLQAGLQGYQAAPGQFTSYPVGTTGYPGGVIPTGALAAAPLAGAVPLTGTVPLTGASYPSSGTVPLTSGVPLTGATYPSTGTIPLTGTAYPSSNYNTVGYSNTQPLNTAYDSRDLNRDGRLSTGEKLAGMSSYDASRSGAHNGLHDSRDLNHDGRISTSEKLQAGAPGHTFGGYGSHGLNRGEDLVTLGYPHTGHHAGTFDARDLNHDGRVSIGEKLAATSLHPHSTGAYDARDTNRDGHVSLGEKLGTPGSQQGTGAYYDSRDLNHDGRISTGEKLAGAAGSRTYNDIGAYDSRDLNRDGHVSVGEKLAAGSLSHNTGIHDSRDLNRDGRVSVGEKLAAGAYPSSTGSYDGRIPIGTAGAYPQTGAYDARDTNRDGRVSIGEKLAGATGSQGIGAYDARDTNRDGHVSIGEKLAGTGSYAPNGSAAYDSRDMNLDGHVSMGEKLASDIGSRQANETRLRLHEEQLAVSKRQVSAGIVGLTKRVQEERVQHRVPVKREELIVERRPLTGVAGEHAAGIPSADEISRVTIYREDIVTHTRLVPTEEIIVRKKIVTEQQNVGATLRSERVETMQSAPTQLPGSIAAGGVLDARDTNMDGHVSAGERLHASMGGDSVAGIHDARDTNYDGRVSMGEKLHAATAPHQFGTSEEMRMRLHEEQLAVSKREVQAGEVNIHKRIQEERVEQMVPVRREELVVERRPLAGIADYKPIAAGPDEVSRVTLYREEIVIEKRLVPIEEVIVRKRVVTDYQTVDAILRSEHFETTQLSGGSDARDTNHDGYVSMGEKAKAAVVGVPAMSQGAFDARDTNHDGYVSTGEKLKSAAVGTSSTGMYDPRDTNHDGRVSMGEKLQGSSATNTGVYDARDTNMDGRVSMSEKLKGSNYTGTYDPRDTNMDGRVSVGEKLSSEAHQAARG